MLKRHPQIDEVLFLFFSLPRIFLFMFIGCGVCGIKVHIQDEGKKLGLQLLNCFLYTRVEEMEVCMNEIQG